MSDRHRRIAQQGEDRGRRVRPGQVDDEPPHGERGSSHRLVRLAEPGVPPVSVAHDAAARLRRAGVRVRTRYRDWTPKVGVAYDVFGDGKTAIKANVGKYVLGQALLVGGLASQPGYNVQLTSSRAWTDNNKNFIPDCDLTRNTDQGPTQAGADNQVDTCLAAVGANALMYSNSPQPQPRGAGRRPLRLGQASVQLGVLGQRAARNRPRRVGERRRVQALVRQLPRHRRHQPHGGSSTRSSASRRRRFRRRQSSAGGAPLPTTGLNTTGFFNVNDSRPATNLQGLSDTMFPGSNVYDHWFGFDLGINAQAPARRHRPGRPQHRSSDDRLLRRRGSGQGGQSGTGRDVAQPHRGHQQLDQHLPHGAEVAPAGEVPRVVHDSEDRGAARRLVPEHSRRRDGGQLTRVERDGHSARARTSPDGWRRDGFDDAGHSPAWFELLHAVQPDRPAPGQDHPSARTRRTSASTSTTSPTRT